MKFSSNWMAVIYFIMGLLFTYLAVQNFKMSGWNFIAILFTFVAALDFGVGYRYLRQKDEND